MRARRPNYHPSRSPAPLGPGISLKRTVALGENIPGLAYFDRFPLFVDMVRSSFGFQTADRTSTGASFSITDAAGSVSYFVAVNPADGYPTSDFSVNTRNLPDNANSVDITWLIDGNATATVLSAGWVLKSSVYNTGADSLTVVVTSPASGDPSGCTMAFTNTNRSPGGGVRSVRCITPGHESKASQVCTDQFIALAADFKSGLRFMDYQNTNQNAATTSWSNRNTITRGRTMLCYDANGLGGVMAQDPGGPGDSVDWIPFILKESGANGWVNIPNYVTGTDWPVGMATACEAVGLTTQFAFEARNEFWNAGLGKGYTSTIVFATAEVLGSVDDSNRPTRKIISMTRSGGIVTVVTDSPHGLTTGWTHQFVNYNPFLSGNPDGDGTVLNAVVSVVNSTTYTFTNAGDGTASFASFSSSTRTGSITAATTLNYDGNADPYAAQIRYGARQLVQASDAVRGIVGDAKMHSQYQFVFCWQMAAIDSYYGALEYIKNGLGVTVSSKLTAVGGAPYHFGTNAANIPIQYGSDQPLGGTYGDSVFNANSTAYTKQNYVDAYAFSASLAPNKYHYEKFRSIATDSGLKFWCYEGGSDTFDRNEPLDKSSAAHVVWQGNNLAKTQAIFDTQFSAIAKNFCDLLAIGGCDRMVHYNADLQSRTTQDGFGNWPLTDYVDVISPKWQGFRDHVANPPSVSRHIAPCTFDARERFDIYDTTGLSYPNWSNSGGGQDWSYSFFDPIGTTRTITVTYKWNYGGTAHDMIPVRNGVVGAPITLPLTGETTTEHTVSFPMTTLQGFNSFRCRRDVNQGNDIEPHLIQIA